MKNLKNPLLYFLFPLAVLAVIKHNTPPGLVPISNSPQTFQRQDTQLPALCLNWQWDVNAPYTGLDKASHNDNILVIAMPFK